MSQPPPPPGQYPPQYPAGQYPPQYQQGYQPPMMPPPTWQAVQAPRTKSKGPMIIGIVAVVVILGAAVGYFVSSSGKADADPAANSAPVTVAPPVAPSTPGAGSTPTGVTLPVPGVDDPVASTVPETTVAPSGGTGGVTPTPVGETVPLAANVTVAIPQGWQIFNVAEQSVEFGIGSSSVFVLVAAGAATPAEDINTYWQSLSGVVADLQTTAPEPFSTFSPSFVETQSAYYSGVVSTSQSGNVPVIGWVLCSLRADGVVVIIDMMWTNDGSGSAPPEFLNGITGMLQSSVFG